MTNAAVPYSLRPKATKLAEGPDGSLEPSETPTDPAKRATVPFIWPRVDTSKGSSGPPDAPLAPSATDPAKRTAAPFVWPRGLPGIVPNRPLADLVAPVGDLDPDIALWRQVLVSIWPFTGHPTDGIWPAGWMGIDNTSTPWICTVHGEPGTWQKILFNGITQITNADFTVTITNPTGPVTDLAARWGYAASATAQYPGSPVGLITPEGVGDLFIDSAGPGLWQATGLLNTDWQQFTGSDTGWINAAGLLNAGWAVGSSGVCQYRRLNGVVYVQANLDANAAANPAFTLPAGFRPGHFWIAPSTAPLFGSATLVLAQVATTGAISMVDGSNAVAGGSLGLAFPAAP